MATEVGSMPVNGNYAPHHGYGGIEHQQNSYGYVANSSTPSQAAVPHAPPATTTPATAASSQQSDLGKDEVGWYFVEQYYTTLSRNPEKLYLFYNKRSQFVSGEETDKVAVCVGQRAIHDKIKELDFQDCKVRVTNVDSQASDANIVIQVVGEISNKSQPHKKFVQTFILATQTNGYFVLNDIFRYLIDEEEEADQEAEPVAEEVQQVPAAESESNHQEPEPVAAAEAEPKGLTSSSDPDAIEHDAQQVDKELEDKVLQEEPKIAEMPKTPESLVNGVSDAEPEEKEAEEAPTTVADEVTLPDPTAATLQPPTIAVEDELKTENPPAPEPTPAPSPPKQAAPTPAPAPAAKPAAPKTWASLAASANRGVVSPVLPSAASSNGSQTKPAPAASKQTTATPPSAAPVQAPSAPAAQRDASPAEGSTGDEWTAVGHNRQQSRQTNIQQETTQGRGYIKNVHEGIDGSELRSTLEGYGELSYFDISRQKNCAFVDWKSTEGYNAAVAANPHTVSGERIYVEERRFRPGATPYVQRGQFQGNRGRGGPGQGAPRGNYQGRGGYQPRGGRGGAPPGMPRGRGGTQAV